MVVNGNTTMLHDFSLNEEEIYINGQGQDENHHFVFFCIQIDSNFNSSSQFTIATSYIESYGVRVGKEIGLQLSCIYTSNQ